MKKLRIRDREIHVVTGIVFTLLLTLALFHYEFGCATGGNLQKTGYDILASAKVTYDTTLTALGDMQKQGKLSDSDVQKILSVARPYYLAYQTALSAYNVYNANVSAQSQDAFVATMAELSKQLGNMIALLDQYGVDSTQPKTLQANIKAKIPQPKTNVVIPNK